MSNSERPRGDSKSQRPQSSAREAATDVARRLIAEGFTAYFAGGCVRDDLLGLEPIDFDLATDAHPHDIARIFRSARSVGESFGVMLVRSLGRATEVATFRTDGKYEDGRRPSEVRFASAAEDAGRRDFTINGLFQHPLTKEVVDFVQGQSDLKAGVLRAIGDPGARLNEDRLRTLRAARFAARFSLRVDPSTASAIANAACDLTGVSRERIGGELRRMLSHETRARAIELIEEWGLDAPALRESNSTGLLTRVAALPSDASFATALAAWRFDRAARPGAGAPSQWRDPINLSARESSDLDAICAIVERLRGEWSTLSVAAQKRLAARATFAPALAVVGGENPAQCKVVSERVAVLAAEHGGLEPIPLVTGGDLIALGCTPGPRFKAILDALYDRQLEGVITEREQAQGVARAEWFS